MAHKVLEDLKDYVLSLKRHTKGRRALHIRLSACEKQFRESYYRQAVGACIRPLIDHFKGKSFAFPNGDLIVTTLDANSTNFSSVLMAVARALKESAIVSRLDPAFGLDDAVFRWFDLEADYQSFRDYVRRFEASLDDGSDPLGAAAISATPVQQSAAISDPETASNSQPGAATLAAQTYKAAPGQVQSIQSPTPRPKKIPKLVKDTYEKPKAPELDLDPDMLVKLMNALKTTDLEPFIQYRDVSLQVPGAPAKRIMTHHFVPVKKILEALLGDATLKPNRWFYRYMEDQLSDRLLATCPEVPRIGSLAGSIRVTAASIEQQAFQDFERSITGVDRSKVILEFSIFEVLEGLSRYLDAAALVRQKGFGLSIADIDIRALRWLDVSNLGVKFLKVEMPSGPAQAWLSKDDQEILPKIIKNITQAKAAVVLSKIKDLDQIDLAQEFGITLFQEG